LRDWCCKWRCWHASGLMDVITTLGCFNQKDPFIPFGPHIALPPSNGPQQFASCRFRNSNPRQLTILDPASNQYLASKISPMLLQALDLPLVQSFSDDVEKNSSLRYHESHHKGIEREFKCSFQGCTNTTPPSSSFGDNAKRATQM
jgi:hypothetical protein